MSLMEILTMQQVLVSAAALVVSIVHSESSGPFRDTLVNQPVEKELMALVAERLDLVMHLKANALIIERKMFVHIILLNQHVQLTLVKAEDFNVTKYQRLQLFL